MIVLGYSLRAAIHTVLCIGVRTAGKLHLRARENHVFYALDPYILVLPSFLGEKYIETRCLVFSECAFEYHDSGVRVMDSAT